MKRKGEGIRLPVIRPPGKPFKLLDGTLVYVGSDRTKQLNHLADRFHLTNDKAERYEILMEARAVCEQKLKKYNAWLEEHGITKELCKGLRRRR